MNTARGIADRLARWARIGLRSPALICASIACVWWIAMFLWFAEGGLWPGGAGQRTLGALALGFAGWGVADLTAWAGRSAWKQHDDEEETR